MAETSAGQAPYMEQLLKDLRARFDEMERICRDHADSPGSDAAHAMAACAAVISDPECCRLIADIDRALQPRETPDWSD